MIFKELFNKIIAFVYPNYCLDCGEIIEEGEYFCDCCYELIHRINADKQCIKCGLPKGKCDCNKKVYSFSAITAPFYNKGGAQKAMYAYKFRRQKYVSEFFAEQMSLNFKYVYSDIHFDGICYVPLSSKSYRRRGFNQSREIAVKMSEILKIPLVENALGCKNKRKSQHKTKADKREENVKDKYYPLRRISGRILLVDDIKTTGATLNECAKQLLSSGAESVYCITGLITYNKDKK